MTSLKGNLNSVDLANIFQMLTLNSREGTLYIFEGASRKAIFFGHDGVSMLSKGRTKSDALGRILLRYDRLTPQQLVYAVERQSESGRLLGQVLVEENLCSRADIDEALQLQIQEEVYNLFIWKDAQFEFVEGEPDEEFRSEGVQKLTFNVNSVIMEAARRVDEWQWIQSLVPDTREVFRYNSRNVPLTDSIFQEPYSGKVLAAIDGKRSVDEVIAASYVNKFEVCKIIALLTDAGAIEKLPVPELRREADAAVAAGDTQAALKFLSRLIAVKSDSPEMHEQLAKAFEREHELANAARHYGVYAQMLADQGKAREAFEVYRRICEFLPTDLAAADRMIEIFTQHPAGIEHHAKSIIERGRQLAEIYVELKRPSRAIQVLHRVVSLGPEDAELRNRLISVYLASGMTGEAISEYESLAEMALAVDDDETAERIYRKVLAIDRHRQDVVQRLDDLLSKRRRRRQNMKSLVVGGAVLAVLGAAGWFGLGWWKDRRADQLRREAESQSQLDAVRVVASPLRSELDELLRVVAERPADLVQLADALKASMPRISDVDARASDAMKRINVLRAEYPDMPVDADAVKLANELSGRLTGVKRSVTEIQRTLRENADASVEQAQQMLQNGEPTRGVLAKVEFAARIAADCDGWLATEKGQACRELRSQVQQYINKFEAVKKAVEEKIAANDADAGYDLAVGYLSDQDFPPLDLRSEMPLPIRLFTSPPGARVHTREGADTGLVTGPACIVTVSVVQGAAFDVELQGFKRASLAIPSVTEISAEVIKSAVKRRYDLVLEKTPVFRKGTSDGKPVTAAPFASQRFAVIPSNRSCDVVDLAKKSVVSTLALNGDRGVRASGVVTSGPDEEATVVVPTGDGALMFFEAATGRSKGTWNETAGGLTLDLELAGGDVIAADDRGGVYCVTIVARQKRWKYEAVSENGQMTSLAAAPTVAGDAVYLPCVDGAVHVLDLRDGRRTGLITPPVPEPGRLCGQVTVAKGFVYFASRDGVRQTRVTKWNLATSRAEWSTLLAGEVRSAPLVHDGTVFAVTSTGEIHGVRDLDGTTTHSGSLDRSVRVLGEATLDGGVLYVGCDNGVLYALDLRGTEIQPIWKFPVKSGTGLTAKPVPITTRCVFAGGYVLFGAADASVYALDGSR